MDFAFSLIKYSRAQMIDIDDLLPFFEFDQRIKIPIYLSILKYISLKLSISNLRLVIEIFSIYRYIIL